MRKLYLMTLAVFLCLTATTTYAQNDLLGALRSSEPPRTDYAEYTFKGSRIVSGQSTELRGHKVLEFIIMHRFGQLNSGAYELFGLDNANIRFGLEYGLLDWINVGIGRSSFEKTYDGFVKLRIARQSTGASNFPVNITTLSTTTVNTLRELALDRPDFPFSARMAYTHQVLISRKFSQDFSLQVMPTWVHRNEVQEPEINNVYAVGIGGRIKLSNRLSLNAEYYYQANKPDNGASFNPLAIGVDIETGGHVFQLHVTNARTMNEKGFISETMGNLSDGDIHFGFNISRVFDL